MDYINIHKEITDKLDFFINNKKNTSYYFLWRIW